MEGRGGTTVSGGLSHPSKLMQLQVAFVAFLLSRVRVNTLDLGLLAVLLVYIYIAAVALLQHLSLVAEERTIKGSYIGSCVPVRDIPRYIQLYK